MPPGRQPPADRAPRPAGPAAPPPAEQELLARLIAQKLVLVAQACLLRRHAPSWVADAFIATRIVHGSARVVGAIDARTLDVAALLERALPA
jgi:putative acyl-CoA dehydrogenase